MYGQKRNQKDIKTEPLDEFITQTSNNLSDAAQETPVQPGAAAPADNLEAKEIDEEGLELPERATHKTGKDDNVSDQ